MWAMNVAEALHLSQPAIIVTDTGGLLLQAYPVKPNRRGSTQGVSCRPYLGTGHK